MAGILGWLLGPFFAAAGDIKQVVSVVTMPVPPDILALTGKNVYR